MLVEDAMTPSVISCSWSDNLEETALKMWNFDIGVVPIVNDQGSPIGMITDRDICMAVALQHKPASSIRVSEVMNGSIVCCERKQNLQDALHLLAQEKIRRLPVIDEEGKLVGVLSMADIAVHTCHPKRGKNSECTVEEFVNTFRQVAPPHPRVPETKLAAEAV